MEEKSHLECQSNELSKSLAETQHKLTVVDSGEKIWQKSISIVEKFGRFFVQIFSLSVFLHLREIGTSKRVV